MARAAAAAASPSAVLVLFSSQAAAGPSREGRPTEASSPPRPVSAYGQSKLEAERLLTEAGGLDLVILRPPAVYGPRDRQTLAFFRLARSGVLPAPAPRARVSLVHAGDLVRGALQAAAAGRAGGTYFMAAEPPVDGRELAALLGGAVGRRVRVLPVPRAVLWAAATAAEAAGRIRGRAPILNRDKARELGAGGWVCDSGPARLDFAFAPAIPHAEGFRDTAAWYRRAGWLG